jgi:DNA-directed RNA polymerase subunit D
MKVEIIKQAENEVMFTVEGIGPALANAIRRAAMFEVPTLAIEDVYFSKNSSVLYDEIVAHRLGLVPLKTDLKSYNLPSACTCKGKLCAKCSVKGTLKAKGPVTVYAEDLKFKDPSVKALHLKIPIVKLLEGQELELEFAAVLGQGKEHTKWSSCHLYYRGWPEFDTKDADLDKAFASIPEDIAKKSGRSVEILDFAKWQPAYEEILEKSGVKITNRDDKFVFTVESWGQLSPKTIMTEALDVLQDKLKTVKLK